MSCSIGLVLVEYLLWGAWQIIIFFTGKITHLYKESSFQCVTFCPQAFSIVFQKAVERATPDESLRERVNNLIDSITFCVYQYTTRGLFECDKLTYLTQLTFQVKVN